MKARKKATPWKKALAVYMSRHKSWPEKKLWAELRDNKLGVRIYAQKVLFGYIADFWCPKAKLVIEVDGSQHLEKKSIEYDAKRDAVMLNGGIKTVRYTAKAVFNNLPAVVALIKHEISFRIKS
jgi:very-short-patch-repair endonuclease